MSFLVDANVLSEPTKATPKSRVVEWVRRNERELAVDPIVLGELRFGILVLPKGRRRTRLERWLGTGIQDIHCSPWEAETGMRWAQLLASLRQSGRGCGSKTAWSRPQHACMV